LLMKKKTKKPKPNKDLSPMAQSIMQKLAEHDKIKGLDPDVDQKSDGPTNK
jgi:hypothetical protein